MARPSLATTGPDGYWFGDTWCLNDLSKIDPDTIHPAKVGVRAAFQNYQAFMFGESVRAGHLTRDAANYGFDRCCSELDAMLSAAGGEG